MARPRRKSTRWVVTFYLHADDDADILQFRANHPHGQAQAILQTMRAGGLLQIQPPKNSPEDSSQAAMDILSAWEM